MDDNFRTKQIFGIFLVILAMALFSLKDSFVKMLDGYYSPVFIMWIQMLFASIFWTPIVVVKYSIKSLIPENKILQILRSSFVITGIGMFYWSISLIPLAEATAISFTAPLVTTAISPLILKEKIGIRRWISVLVGFGGVLLILKPDFGGDRLGYLVAFGAGISIGFFYTFNRLLAGKAPPLVNLTYSSTIGALLLAPLIFSVWAPIRLEDWHLLVGFAAIAAVGQTCLFFAFVYGEASILAPITLSQIIFATLFGYIFFLQFPDKLSVIGIFVFIFSAVYIAIRETRNRT